MLSRCSIAGYLAECYAAACRHLLCPSLAKSLARLDLPPGLCLAGVLSSTHTPTPEGSSIALLSLAANPAAFVPSTLAQSAPCPLQSQFHCPHLLETNGTCPSCRRSTHPFLLPRCTCSRTPTRPALRPSEEVRSCEPRRPRRCRRRNPIRFERTFSRRARRQTEARRWRWARDMSVYPTTVRGPPCMSGNLDGLN